MTQVQTIARLTDAANVTGAFLGGGTLLMRDVNYAAHTIPTLIRITDPMMREVRTEGDRLWIGAGMTMASVIAHRDLEALRSAALAIGGPAVRNMATIGGNLFAPHPYGDFTVALLALDAKVHFANGRESDLETFLRGRDQNRDLVTAVSIQRNSGADFRFKKVTRTKPKGVSVLSIAAHLEAPGGRVKTARVAFGAMGPTPLRAKATETALRGASLDEGGITPALNAVLTDLEPSDDPLASAWYRRTVAPVHLKRLLLERR
ncbi:MAG: FAD binding domain-containing protein [Pseudomonadota bacterium]